MGDVARAAQLHALFEAAQRQDVEAFKGIASAVGDPDELKDVREQQGRSCLHYAASGGSATICTLLIDTYGFAVDLADEAGVTPLALASGSGAVEAMDVLLAHGADPCASTHSDGIRPLHRAATALKPDAITRLASCPGVEVDAPSGMGTPVCLAAHTGRPQNISALLKLGASPNCGTAQGVPGLLLAVAGGSIPCVKVLTDAGADATAAASSGTTPLHVAASLNDELAAVAIGRILLQAGGRADAADEQGATPLMVAAARRNRPLLELMLPTVEPKEDVEWTVDGLIKHVANTGLLPATAREDSVAEVVGEAEEPDAKEAARLKTDGDAAFRAGDGEAALELYTASLRHDTRNPFVWANRSAALLQLQRPREALADARKARALDPSYVKAWYREALAHEMMHQWEEAAVAYFEANQRAPETKSLEDAMMRAIKEAQEARKAAQLAADLAKMGRGGGGEDAHADRADGTGQSADAAPDGAD